MPYFVSGTVIDSDSFRYSTPIARINPADHRLHDPKACPITMAARNGAASPRQVDYLRLHGLPVPALSKDVKAGEQSAICKAGKTTLPPLLFTTGLTHRFTCYLKADKPAEVVVEVGGRFDGKAVVEQKKVQVGSAWTAVSLDFLPPQALVGGLRTTVTVPKEAVVLVDAALSAGAGRQVTHPA